MILQSFLVIFSSLLTLTVLAKQSTKQEMLNAVISETMVQNTYLFPPTTAGSISHSPPQYSEMHSLCSRMDSDDPNRQRVGCCQHKHMKIMYNMQLRGGEFEMMFNHSNHSNKKTTLPMLNSLR
jgi:hypothetical protein